MSQAIAFNHWLKSRRTALDLTQWDLADRVGCSREAIQKIESGTRRPSRQIAELLIACLEIPPAERPALVRWARLGPEAAPSELPLVAASSSTAALIESAESAPPSNLPAPLTSLIGRDEAVEAVRRSLLRDEVRLLTLVGPPGIGKTRLGIAVAARLAEHFRDGVHFVALDTVNDTRLVITTIANSLGLKPNVKQPVAEAVAGYLHDKHLLLVLDNFEQVLDAGSEVLQLLSACPNSKVLVTSREPLHAYGECRFRVPPLELPDRQHLSDPDVLAGLASIVLFLQRAQARKPDWTLTPVNAGTIADICLHLDGLPLAIELAAARIEELSPEQILAGLGDRLKLLRADLRYLPPRQQTLRGAIDWSYHLLTLGERTLFRRLSAFVGGCNLAAVQAVCNAHQDLPFEPQAGITALSSKSLLYRETGVEDEPRWRMLESIREYARERLESSGEAPEIHRLQAEYYAMLAETFRAHLDGPEELPWLDCLDQDHDNLRAALDWAIAQSLTEIALRLSTAAWPFWWRRGYVSEGRRWLNAVLSLPGDGVADLLRAKAFHAAGALARVQSDFDSAKQFHQQALILRRRVGDHKGIAASLNSLGIPLMFEGHYAEAEVLFQESLNAYRELGLKAPALMPLNNLAVTVMYQGDYERAQQLHEEALGLYRELQDRQGMAGSLGNLGDVLRYQGNYARARQVLEESLSIFREARSKQDIAITLDSLARVDLATGHIDCAVLALAESLTLNREVGDKMAIADNLEGLAAAICAQADRLQTLDASICAAVRWLAAADRLRGAIGSPRSPTECAEVDRVVAQLRDQLTPDTFRVEWCHGETMSAQQAVEEALAHLEQTA